mmetsp:Transcript_58992/g.123212  ORF Transcript_58992/g.123212 Transcript_58992/m.123212 type:complete len:346 (-) Transcript_58992:1482-2519(-)
MRRGVAMRKAEYATRRAVGMICPPPRCMGLGSRVASSILSFTLRTGSSHSGPSRVPHWNPWTTLSLMEESSCLSTSDGRVSSTSTLGPSESGPKAHTDLAASTSQSYLLWRNDAWRLRSQVRQMLCASMSSARPFSRGSAMRVSLLRRLGVSAKHLREDVSTTVSQRATEGSAVLISMSEYMRRRSCITQSRYTSPVPRMRCSPDSSTLVPSSGYDLFTLRRPSSILGSSEGLSGSSATFMTALVECCSGRRMLAPSTASCVTVAVLIIESSMPSTSTHIPAVARSMLSRYRPWYIQRAVTSLTVMSSSSSAVYPSPSTFTVSPTRRVPEMMRPKASKVTQSGLW